jgi:hypothetical protein
MGTYLSHPAPESQAPQTCVRRFHIAHRLPPVSRRPQTLRLQLQYNTLVPGPPRDVLAVQVLEQRNRVFPADPGKLFERSNR